MHLDSVGRGRGRERENVPFMNIHIRAICVLLSPFDMRHLFHLATHRLHLFTDKNIIFIAFFSCAKSVLFSRYSVKFCKCIACWNQQRSQQTIIFFPWFWLVLWWRITVCECVCAVVVAVSVGVGVGAGDLCDEFCFCFCSWSFQALLFLFKMCTMLYCCCFCFFVQHK